MKNYITGLAILLTSLVLSQTALADVKVKIRQTMIVPQKRQAENNAKTKTTSNFISTIFIFNSLDWRFVQRVSGSGAS